MKLALAAASLAISCFSPTSHAVRYVLQDLGNELVADHLLSFGDRRDELRIGPSGEVVGTGGGNLLIHANGSLQRIAPPQGHRVQRVSDVNSRGDVLVQLTDTTTFRSSMAIYRNGGFVPIGSPTARYSYAYRLNADGDAIGTESSEGATNPTIVRMNAAGSSPIPVTSGNPDFSATTINDSGAIAGFPRDKPANAPFFVEDGSLTSPDPIPEIYQGYLHDMNAHGVAVGWARPENRVMRPFVATSDGYSELEIPRNTGNFFTEGMAYSINDRGDIVGGLAFSRRAVLWQNGKASVLGDLVDSASPVFLLVAMDINNAGQIVGLGGRGPFQPEYAFLLTPVPEPETTWLTAAGLTVIGVVLARSKKRRRPSVGA